MVPSELNSANPIFSFSKQSLTNHFNPCHAKQTMVVVVFFPLNLSFQKLYFSPAVLDPLLKTLPKNSSVMAGYFEYAGIDDRGFK